MYHFSNGRIGYPLSVNGLPVSAPLEFCVSHRPDEIDMSRIAGGCGCGSKRRADQAYVGTLRGSHQVTIGTPRWYAGLR
jgi:hypothetical protein